LDRRTYFTHLPLGRDQENYEAIFKKIWPCECFLDYSAKQSTIASIQIDAASDGSVILVSSAMFTVQNVSATTQESSLKRIADMKLKPAGSCFECNSEPFQQATNRTKAQYWLAYLRFLTQKIGIK